MRELFQDINELDLDRQMDKSRIIRQLAELVSKYGYRAVETITDKPWGAMVRFDTYRSDDFLENFFPELDEQSIQQNHDIKPELSPKFLLVNPEARLSWQRHNRRAELWSFITEGAYHVSDNPDDQGELISVTAGQIVQFEQGQCHRLVGQKGESYTLVAEIWQHTNPNNPSDEDDIVRLDDDYSR